jgi:uncharacterized membrane protein
VTVEANSLPSRRSRLLYPAFVLSLALNLLFLGGVAAAIWHHHKMTAKGHDYGLMRFSKELAPARRDAFRQQVSDTRASLRGDWKNVRDAWIEGNNILTAEPFDKDKFKAAMDKLRDVERQYKAGLNDNFANIAASLTPEERELLKTWRERRKPWFSKQLDKSDDKGGTKTD